MAIVFKAAGLAITALTVIFVLRGVSGNFAVFVKALAVVLLFGMVVLELAGSISAVRELVSDFIDGDSFVGTSLSVMIKALGIALVGRICADICKECGENGLAQGVESVAGVVILSLALPILSEILDFASNVLQRGA